MCVFLLSRRYPIAFLKTLQSSFTRITEGVCCRILATKCSDAAHFGRSLISGFSVRRVNLGSVLWTTPFRHMDRRGKGRGADLNHSLYLDSVVLTAGGVHFRAVKRQRSGCVLPPAPSARLFVGLVIKVTASGMFLSVPRR